MPQPNGGMRVAGGSTVTSNHLRHVRKERGPFQGLAATARRLSLMATVIVGTLPCWTPAIPAQAAKTDKRQRSRRRPPAWRMTRAEWLEAGAPDYGLGQMTPESTNVRKPWRDTALAERRAVNDFIKLFPDPIDAFHRGQLVSGQCNPERMAPERDQAFADRMGGHLSFSSRIRLQGPDCLAVMKRAEAAAFDPKAVRFYLHSWREDARQAIVQGRKLGYADEDILHQVIHGYVIGAYLPELRVGAEDAVGDGDHAATKRVYRNQPIPPAVKRDFPALRGFDTL